jgi:hypothetical protein
MLQAWERKQARWFETKPLPIGRICIETALSGANRSRQSNAKARMDPANQAMPLGRTPFYWPPIWVMLSAVVISLSTGIMVWEGNADTHHVSVTVAPNERGSVTNPEIEPG